MRRAANVVSCLIVALAVGLALRGWVRDEPRPTLLDPGAHEVSPEFLKAAGTGPRLGTNEASVILVLYSDYRCTFCRDFDEKLRIVRGRYPQHLAVVVKPFVKLGTTEVTKL